MRGWRYHAGPLPHIAGRSYDGAPQLLPLFDLTEADSATLRAMQGEHGWFCPVADVVLDRLDRTRFVSRAERADADYLYDAAAFRDYAGAGLGAKRAAVERLLARHALQVVDLDPGGAAAALEVLQGWCDDKGLDPDGADAPACREALSLVGGRGPTAALSGHLHFADGEPAGFVLFEELNPGVQVVRFSKALRRFDGIFPAMYRHLARSEAVAARWLNFEQDLGRPNFRRSKLSFRPARLLPKHRVRVGP